MKLSLIFGAAAALAVTAASGSALAAEDEEVSEGGSYASATLGCDAGAAGIAVMSFAVRNGTPALAGAGVYALCAPIVHAVHERYGIAFASLGARLGMPAAGAFTGALVGVEMSRGCHGELCGLGAAFTGGLVGGTIGMIGASIIDAAVLAREPEKPRASRVSVSPSIDPIARSGGIQIGGAF
jgi:hypothetical protein